MPEFQLVDPATEDGYGKLLGNVPRVGVDTEFMRERTYFAELCLVQVATGQEIFCIDPTNLPAADPARGRTFWESMLRPAWVLHSARQDIEVVYQASGLMPCEVFDTQVAAGLLGYQPQLGYAGLVAELFGVELAKSHTRADWSKRPLAEALIAYAAEDVEYLLPAFERLGEALEKSGRLGWAIEDSAALLERSLYVVEPGDALERLRGAGKLQGAARSAARALAAWREREALARNRPRQWIMRDPVLVAVATTRPRDEASLARIDGLQERTIRRVGRQLLEVLRTAGQDDDYRPPARPDESQKKTLKELKRRVAAVASELGVAAELIAPRKELSAAMLGERDSRVFGGWRRGLIGEQLLEILGNA